MREITKMIKLWKKFKIEKLSVTFSCGGDSMGDIDFNFFDVEGNNIPTTSEDMETLYDYFSETLYDNVSFYENSDGHYQGESGTVEITYDDSEKAFIYDKCAMADFSEVFTGIMRVTLSSDEIEVLQKISDANSGDNWGEYELILNYKEDCIITDEEEELLNNLFERVNELSLLFEIEDTEGEFEEDSHVWETSIEIENGELLVEVRDSYLVQQESDF